MPPKRTTLPAKIVLSYVFDYAIIVALAAVFFALNAIEPFHQHFALQNYTLQYPYAVHERVPVTLLYIVAIICPALIIAFYTLVIDGLFSHQASRAGRRWTKYPFKDRLWELNCGLLGLLLSEGAAFVITGTFKNAVGKPRPDFIDRCQPVRGSHDPVPFGLSNSTICTQTDQAIMKDGFRSFPSGHSSTSFAGLFYLSLYLAAKLHILDSKGEVWKVFVCLIPTLGAGLIAATRIMDARHHPFDVISGSLLGVLCAWVAYRQYFPPIHETWRKGRAYPIRSWSQESLPPPPQRVGKENMYSGFENATQPRITVSHSRQDSEAPLTAPAAEPASESRPESGETLQPSTYSRPGRHRREDSYEGYSSSDAGDEYELRPGYTLGDQRRQMYDRVQEQLSGDISYHSPAQQAENV